MVARFACILASVVAFGVARAESPIASIEVSPSEIQLRGPNASSGVLVMGRTDDGRLIDLNNT